MKKILAAILVLTLALSLCAFAVAEGAISYADYIAAAIDDEVTIEACVQDHQGWWEDNGQGLVTIYAADADGAYFLYNVPMSQEDAEKLVPGARFVATGFKSEWSGEVELTDVSSFEFVDGDEYIADPVDVTDLLGTDALAEKMNQKVAFKGMTVEPSTIEGDETEYAFLYNWDGSGEEGNDLYFNVSKDGTTYTFTVESYLTPEGSEVYEAVKALNVGDVVDLEGFLYWYNGANPHITAVSAAE